MINMRLGMEVRGGDREVGVCERFSFVQISVLLELDVRILRCGGDALPGGGNCHVSVAICLCTKAGRASSIFAIEKT